MFKLVSQFKATGDQPKAIAKLTQGMRKSCRDQVLLGITGSGKTFTMASVIQNVQLPTLIISPNKTLASQLYQEFKTFFPENAVHYFVSYYDYYQPEAYLPALQLYISKDARINEEIDRLRHAALQDILVRKDIIVIASVSCIYGAGDPSEYQKIRLELKKDRKINLSDAARHLQFLQYERGKTEKNGAFSAGKEHLLINLVTGNKAEIEWRKDKISKIVLDGKPVKQLSIYPAKFWVTPQNKLRLALRNIKTEMEERIEEFQSAGKFEEAERIERRTLSDIEMLRKTGYASGIENYSRHLSFRNPGEPPATILDYFPKPFLLFIDESHISVPQIRGMYHGDAQRKTTLIEHGFRLPSALDNRPLTFDEFLKKINQKIYVSATPGPYELSTSEQKAEQLIRPTGILDPEIEIRPAKNQVKDLLKEIAKRTGEREKILALTLTKRSAEDLTEYLLEQKVKAQYLHSDVKTLKRPKILNDLRRGKIDVIVGINLLREGLDLPEVNLVAVLDADREGFLRNYRSIIQMAGRAARSTDGKVILYADEMTGSIKKAVRETNRRRKIQTAFNKKYGIVPQSIKKPVNASNLI